MRRAPERHCVYAQTLPIRVGRAQPSMPLASDWPCDSGFSPPASVPARRSPALPGPIIISPAPIAAPTPRATYKEGARVCNEQPATDDISTRTMARVSGGNWRQCDGASELTYHRELVVLSNISFVLVRAISPAIRLPAAMFERLARTPRIISELGGELELPERDPMGCMMVMIILNKAKSYFH